jgi:hypothetical protein
VWDKSEEYPRGLGVTNEGGTKEGRERTNRNEGNRVARCEWQTPEMGWSCCFVGVARGEQVRVLQTTRLQPMAP